MLHKIDGRKIWAVCISTQRPTNVPKITKHIDTTWYVCPNETHQYKTNGASAVVEVDGNIVVARNRALADALANDCSHCLQLSDDVTKFIEFINLKKYVSVDFDYVIKKMIGAIGENIKLVGLSINDNPRNYKPSYYTKNKLIVNDCILADSRLVYDEKADLKEDYDMFLSIVTGKGSVMRLDNLSGSFPHRGNKGGANTYRNFFRELKCNDYIKNKWGALVKDHKTRDNQIEVNYPLLKKKYGI